MKFWSEKLKGRDLWETQVWMGNDTGFKEGDSVCWIHLAQENEQWRALRKRGVGVETGISRLSSCCLLKKESCLRSYFSTQRVHSCYFKVDALHMK